MKGLRAVGLAVLLPTLLPLAASAAEHLIEPGAGAQERLQEALILAQPGDRVRLAPGRYRLSDGLSLDVEGVTVSGAGLDGPNASVLSFAGQEAGAQGLLVTGDRVVLEDFAIEDTKGDGIKAKGVQGIVMRRLRVEWNRGPHTDNGAYGLYPVESTDVLVEGCMVSGASDAGIYVGQSDRILVRNNRVEFNVAGIEIENSFNADVYGNTATHNTGGILVFDLPNLPQQGGHHTRVFENEVVDNDTPNFAAEGNTVALVPMGVGVMVMANSDVAVFDNRLGDNATANVLLVTNPEEFDDSDYNPHPRRIQVYGNLMGRSGWKPDGDFGEIFSKILGDFEPDIIWDGVVPLGQLFFGVPERERIVIGDNGDAAFANLDLMWFTLFKPMHSPSFDSRELTGEITPLPPVALKLQLAAD